ncbi:MAG: MarR family transcriptional regulator [Candidatus Dormiibacterota bacterium]
MNVESRDLREVIREEPLRRREILKALEGGARTVPEIAAAISAPTHEAMYWVMGMRKYGWVAEVNEPTDDGLYPYRAVERRGA